MDVPGGNRTLAAAAAALLALGGIVGLAVVDDDDGDDAALPATTTTTTPATTPGDTGPDPAVTLTVSGSTTSTTTARTTTTAAGTTTTTRTASTTSTTGASSTVPATNCGEGRASVSFTAKGLTTDALMSTFTPQATVDNQVSAAIEVEELVLDVVFPNNDVRTVRFTTAGTVIGPGTTASFTAEPISNPKQYESARFTRFTYFTSGQPSACRVTTP
ncbi:MAG: hypothetical protein ACT4PX_04410 [Actinomycetota bacterium]